MGLWRYPVGNKGVSRVTVYERRDSSCIYVEWWDDDGRHKQALKTVLGHPVTDREMAMEMADSMSKAQERKRNQQAAELLGLPSSRTLKELFEQRHKDLKPRWSEKYAKDRELRRAFWLDKLGDPRLTHVNAAVVERIAREAQGTKSDRWRQDVLRYIVDSFIYAEKKLKWIDPKHNLSAVDVPPARGRSVSYTEAEARAILEKLWGVHPVAGWIGAVLAQTGRRLSAVRTLTADRVSVDGEWTMIRFPGETDKARKTGEAAVYGVPERTDWTVPAEEVCNDWIHDAEEAAKVPTVKGRAWHGLKRLYATLTNDMPGADLQSGTLKSTLVGHYRQDLIEPKKDVARALADRLTGQ